MVGCRKQNTLAGIISLFSISVIAACEIKTPKTQSVQTCESANYEHLIGQDKNALNAMKLPKNTRIIAFDMAITMDYNENRLNFYLDEQENIKQISCG